MGLISVIASIAKKSSPDDTALSQLPPANAKCSPLPQLFQQIQVGPNPQKGRFLTGQDEKMLAPAGILHKFPPAKSL